MNSALLSLEVGDPEKAKQAVNLSLRGNDRVDIEVEAKDKLEIDLKARDKTSFRGSLNSVLRLTKLADKILN